MTTPDRLVQQELDGETGRFEVRLDVFEGPFDLLLGLISERRVDVCDVPIAQLTEDYLAHVERLQEMDLEIATEFLVVAATLLQLKARALLPSGADEDGERDDSDVERDLLISRLLEVRTFQGAGSHVADLIAVGDRRYAPAPASDDPALRQLPTLGGISADDLARTLIDVIRDQVRTVDTSLLVSEEISTQEAAEDLVANLSLRGPLTFRQVAAGRSRGWAVAIFLAMLELCLRGEVSLGQGDTLGDIDIRLNEEEPR